MLKLVLVVASVVVVAVVAALLVVPAAGGPEPVLSKPTEGECRAVVGGDLRQPNSVRVAWIWMSDRYGWGCKYGYPDGSSGTAIWG